ncbi:MAG: BMP family ABC transporter substrate-binding protein, partial [Clostridia bacterium]|nr:BMP family ABC transporter substrate-binding protein [Clostridia bacterium]
ATMKVTYTNSWFDIAKEKEAALNLINSGCVLISQHADSEGAPKACEEKGVPNVAYNISTIPMGPNTAIISSKIDWAPYFKQIINAALEGGTIPTDFCGTLENGSVKLTELNTKVAAPGTQEKIDEIKAKLISGEVKVFDTKTFTVGGKELSTYTADIVDKGDFVPDSEAIKDGTFAESSDRSAPYFDIKYIDGISE